MADHYCAEYSGKNLRYSVEAGELRINTLDLSSILGIEPEGPEDVDLLSAFQLSRSRNTAFAQWLLETFKDHAGPALEASESWLYSQMRAHLR